MMLLWLSIILIQKLLIHSLKYYDNDESAKGDRMDRTLISDFHVHTHYSVCARDKQNSHPLRILNHAQDIGMETIGFTDHVAQYPPYATPKWKNCNIEIINSLRRDIERIFTAVQVLVGCEADVIDKNMLSIDQNFAKELDYVMVSASHFHLPGIKQPKSTRVSTVANFYVDSLLIALQFDFVSIIGHPFKTPFNALGPMEGYMSHISDKELKKIAETAKQRCIAMEISAWLARDPEYLHTIKRFINICQDTGVRFSFGSDAHHQKDIGLSAGMEQTITVLGLEPNDFLTADELIRKVC